MRARVLAAAMAAAALTFSATAGAASPAAASPVVTSSASEAAYNDAEYSFLLWLAQSDERAMVRSTAWSALLADDVAAGILQFFETEWEYAESLAESGRQRNHDFVRYIVDTCVPTYSPEVCSAAQAAMRGTPQEQTPQQAAFVQTGYAAAKERDRRHREKTGEQAAALVEADRAYVAMLRDKDPGAQVRLAAAWALRDGATDSDLIEFFSHGWSYAAGLDVRAHRTELAKSAAVWKRTLDRLTIEAKAAEQAARDAAGEAAVQARAAAARAWGAVADSTGPARVAWQNAEKVALGQAEAWRHIATEAAAAGSPNWKPVLGASGDITEQWTTEGGQARTQAAYWAGRYQQAVDAEHAWAKTPA